MSTESNSENNHLAVVGAGYVGLVTGCCFASFGYEVDIIEVNPAKLAALEKGKIPIYEPGLQEIFDEAREDGRLRFHASAKALYEKSSPDIVFIAVGTPQSDDGSCNLSYLHSAVSDLLPCLPNESVFVIKSTVPVGTAELVRKQIEDFGNDSKVAVVNNPEFLKEGTAVGDFLRPERILLGGQDNWALEKVKRLYDPLSHSGRPVFVTNSVTAEISKLGANLMLASRVSLINQISRMASRFGGEIRQIEAILRSDSRIGPKYLNAGLGYGGSCFPKDVKSFIHICRSNDIDAYLAEGIDKFNDEQKLFFIPSIKKAFPNAQQTTIAILGAAFKPETDDIREGPALANVKLLSELGYKIKVFDPKALEVFRVWVQENGLKSVELCSSTEACLKGAQALIMMTEWREFQSLGLGSLKKLFQGTHVYDGKNVWRPEVIRSWGYEYLGVGQQ